MHGELIGKVKKGRMSIIKTTIREPYRAEGNMTKKQKTFVLDGKSKVGEGKVYATQREMDLEKALKYAVTSLEQVSEMMDFDEDGEAEKMKRWCKEVRRDFGLKGSI